MHNPTLARVHISHGSILRRSVLLLTLLSMITDVISVTSNNKFKSDPSSRTEKTVKLIKDQSQTLSHGSPQPEIQSFLPAGTNDLVNPFTGDFSYNIPLMDVGGYPVNIFYQSGITMEDEASWVGLGWNLTPGAVNRAVRGLPDDFSGEEKIVKEVNMKDNQTWALRTGPSTELFGFGVGASAGFQYNTYTGFGMELGANIESSVAVGDLPVNFGGGAGITLSSGGGFTRELNTSMNLKLGSYDIGSDHGVDPNAQVNAGISSNSRAGVTANFNTGFNASLAKKSTEQSLQLNGLNYPLSFAKDVYTPQIDLPMAQRALSFKIKAGGEIQGFTVSAFTQGSYSNQYLASKKFSHPAYGYLYSEKAVGHDDALYDFNRDHGNPFEPENPQLPMTNFSYDIYSISSQGFSGNFRPFRTDVGTVHNNIIKTSSENIGAGGEAAGGSLVKVGVDGNYSSVSAYSGKWQGENELEAPFSFKDDNTRSEKFYFKNIGEPNVMSNEAHFKSMNGFEPFPLKLKGGGLKAATLSHGMSGELQTTRVTRERRNTDLSVLTFEEKRSAALEKVTQLFQPNTSYDTIIGNRIPLQPTLEMQRKNQIAEIRITKDDGNLYYYDLPVYNTRKREVTFSMGGATQQEGSDLITYKPGQDNSTSNKRGASNYFSATETPAYAYAYLLTAIVSQDYVDLSGDGPSADDLGSYTKFNYTKSNENAAWRMPVKENAAMLEKGLEADPSDDMANYTYGEKEIFYLHSIETKNHVAEFKVSPRLDAQSVKGENGGLASNTASMKLDSILLFAKADRVKNGRKAIPIKKVSFSYNYALCANHPNSKPGQGKLTLQSIIISYRNGNRTSLSPYRFRYSNINPSYEEDGGDRWGTYRKAEDAFPLSEKYTPQSNRSQWMDKWASAWALTEIDNPSGSTMKVFYESDDYGYVQEKRAMQMFKIKGLSSSPTSAISGNVYNSNGTSNYIHFDLSEPVNETKPSKEFELKEYLNGVNEIFFQITTNTRFGRAEKEEGVKGFAKFNIDGGFGQSYGFDNASNGLHTSAWIKIDNEPGYESDEVFHPFATATFNMVRTEYNQAGNVALQQDSKLDQIATAFAGMTDAFQEAIGGGFSNRMRSDGIGKNIDPGSSFIRLNNPSKMKLGGGSRVKRIEIHDNWAQMTQQRDSSYFYGVEYEYNKTEQYAGGQRVISSGVASYEPLVGGEENPFVFPKRYTSKLDVLGLSFGPTERKMETQPYGESFFPSPTVGYAEVRIRNLRKQGARITASGFTKKEFYTAKDFPVIYKASAPQLEKFKLPAFPFPIAQISLERVTVAQSHVVELNDMHGKEKAIWIYRESDSLNPISGSEFYYRNVGYGKLSNNVLVAEPDGQVSEKLVGVEYDMIADMREYETSTEGASFQANVDVIMAGFFPIPIPVPVPTIIMDNKLFRTYTTSKIIQRTGILEKVIIHDQGQVSVKNNVLLDAMTGLVVLSSEDNEFGDPIYSLSLPAHWKYPRMSPAYINNGRQWDDVNVVNGRSAIPRANTIFFKGDELLIGNRMAWVHRVDANGIDLIDELGNPWGNANRSKLKVIRSGRRNMQGLTVSKLISGENPVKNGRISTPQKVMDVEVTTYSDEWQTYAGFNITPIKYRCQCPEMDPCQKEVIQEMVRIGMLNRLYDKSPTKKMRAPKELLSRLLNCWSTLIAGNNIWLHFTYGESSMIIRVMNGDDIICTLEMAFASDSGMREFLEQTFDLVQLQEAREKGKSSVADPDITPQGFVFNDGCGNTPNGFSVNFSLNLPGRQIPVKMLGNSSCLQRNCTLERIPADTFCSISTGNRINPYRLGLIGNVRALASYDYMTERTTGDMRTAGYYKSYTDFDFNGNENPNWVFKVKNETIDPFGKSLETVDALNRYASSLYAYDRNVKVAEATNARYRQIAFDSFEDYAYSNDRFATGECALPQHFNFSKHWNASTRCDTISHTGYMSFRVPSGKSYAESRLIHEVPQTNANADNILAFKQQIGVFNPDTGKYLIQAWTYHDNINQRDEDFAIEMSTAGNTSQTYRFKPSGPVIDGWQLLSGEFNIPQGSTSMTMKLDNRSRLNYYVDDIRIMPFDAKMLTYTVDPIQLRVMAALDENHFAAFYEYDEEGNLARIKKETEDGIFTIKEIRSSKPKAQR